ncbi:MAG: preprotein translocase subunit TatB [Firmicutes bacterium]|jgi:tRNA 2-thiouridine synthesizing protein A|nr:preprotein translocase subunit TatB [Bacillota bacterium]
MSNIVDARGLSCPQPVIMTLNTIKKVKKGDIVIVVDTDTAKENVSRAAKAQGWEVADIQPEEDGYSITIRKES